MRREDLTVCSHGPYLRWECWDRTGNGISNFRADVLAEKPCKGCSDPVGPGVDGCAQCASEDESDCW